jgi:Arc/MetJ-type ribon-helix-helix transcriptional regulator
MPDWVTVALPIEIVAKIDELIKAKKYGFRSRGDFVLEAVKMRLKELGYYP